MSKSKALEASLGTLSFQYKGEVLTCPRLAMVSATKLASNDDKFVVTRNHMLENSLY